MIKLIFSLFCAAASMAACAQPSGTAASFQTYTYSITATDTLQLDFFPARNNPRPVTIIFVHGGSFTGGSRANQRPFALPMQELGYNVALISYRLHLKGKSFTCETPLDQKFLAISKAVNDTRSATRFLIDRAATLNVDTTRIVLAGSSAGAETVLHAAYWPPTTAAEGPAVLSPTFRYAAVISYAGALLDINAIQKDNAIPTLLYHGTCDQLVPYAAAPHHYCNVGVPGWMMLFGSQAIFERYQRLQRTVRLYSFCGGGHEVSNYMFRTAPEVHRFLQDGLIQKKVFQEQSFQKLSDKDCSNRILTPAACQ